MMSKILDERVRIWLYGVAVAINVVLLVYGLLDSDTIVAWNGLFAALFGIAMINVPAKKEETPDAD